MNERAAMIKHLVDSFATLDGDLTNENVPELLRCGDVDKAGWSTWRPVRFSTPARHLVELYRLIPGPLPPLFEELLLSYRWLEVDLRLLRLRPNPPGPGLVGFADSILEDVALTDYLFPRRLVPFGKGAGTNYDPVCFDLSKAGANCDRPVVQLDHEDILSSSVQVKEWMIAVTFRNLIDQVLGTL